VVVEHLHLRPRLADRLVEGALPIRSRKWPSNIELTSYQSPNVEKWPVIVGISAVVARVSMGRRRHG
jgi:hypothetical protein